MKLLLVTYMWTFCSVVFYAQDSLVVYVSLVGNDQLQIDIENNSVKGPVRLKFNAFMQDVELLQCKSGKLIKEEDNWIIVWTQLPEQQTITALIEFKSSQTDGRIGMLSYLIEGEITNQNIFFGAKNEYSITTSEESTIPKRFRSLDIDNNNFISALEINQAINGFFDQTNELTVDDLSDLINYFFEQ